MTCLIEFKGEYMKRFFTFLASVSCLMAVQVQAQEKVVENSQKQSLKDDRQIIYVNAEQKAMLLGEMRTFLEAIEQILTATVVDDMQAVVNAARPVGLASMKGVPQDLRAKLPAAFMSMGPETHRGFQSIADDARDLGDPALTLEQLSNTMKNCVACHRAYRLEVNAPVLKP